MSTQRHAADGGDDRTYYPEIFLVSLAGLLLEISYTRVISFKLFYYFTYMTIGLALLGLGAGGVLVAVSRRIQNASTNRVVAICSLVGAVVVGLAYLLIAWLPINTLVFWEYNSKAVVSGLKLLIICVALFASFLPMGIILSTLFSRRPEGMGRLYFADLVGAGLACLIVVPMLSLGGPPSSIALAAFALAATAALTTLRTWRPVAYLSAALSVVYAFGVIVPDAFPDVATDLGKRAKGVTDTELLSSEWSPLFRVDVRDAGDQRTLIHDGLGGSVMRRWDGNVSSLASFGYDKDFRQLPFAVLGAPPQRVSIIGAAAGNEVAASLFFRAEHIDAVEINPETYKLVTEKMADYNGHLAQNPSVDYVRADGRTFMARSKDTYDLVWLPAPDSYSATNASTASAFVLSESYLYTVEAMEEYLDHLGDGGILAAQFGEMAYENRPNRTARFVATVRAALENRGIDEVASHFLVSVSPPDGLYPGVSTILVKPTPFTDAEVQRFATAIPKTGTSILAYAPGVTIGRKSPVNRSIELDDAALRAFRNGYPSSIDAVYDDKPFFWHFSDFASVTRKFAKPIKGLNVEVEVGERALILLLGVAFAMSALFLFIPFFAIRKRWQSLPRKTISFAYFSAIGLGFIFLEITLIQRFVLFLGYPTYSLTVTLSSLLLSVGVGALLSERLAARWPWRRWLPIALAVIVAFLLFGVTPMTDALLDLSLALRIALSFVVLIPLGLVLGMFMPFGVSAVAAISAATTSSDGNDGSDGSDHDKRAAYVAWAWAVNGFASVVGSVLATMLAMAYGFQTVLVVSVIAYAIAMLALTRLERPLNQSMSPGRAVRAGE